MMMIVMVIRPPSFIPLPSQPNPHETMLHVGLTGSIGSGKSTAAAQFEQLGIPVYYADDAAKRLMTDSAPLREAIEREFGPGIYLDGVLQRKELAARAFASDESTQRINTLVHPAVHDDFVAWFAQQSAPYAVREAAILFESGTYQNCDAVVLVEAPLDLRVQRRRDIFSRYVSRLSDLEGISFMPEATYGQGTRWLTVLMIDPEKNRSTPEVVRLALEAHNIEARPVWKPMHMQPVFGSARSIGGQVASRLYEQGLCLPSGTAMSDDDVDRISQIVRDALRTH